MDADAKFESYIAILIIVGALIVAYLIISSGLSSVDTDNDGVVDEDDAFPSDKYETNDTDKDGIGDNTDSFPFDPSASIDSDNDGYPDYFNEGKSNADSTSSPPLELDMFPYNPNEWSDSDNDGVGDNSDVFPQDPSESKDTDGDGIGDNQDANPYVDLSFTLSIHRVRLIRNVDLLGWAQLYLEVQINEGDVELFDNNEAYWKVRKNTDSSLSVDIVFDIDDSDGSSETTIDITLYDADWIFQDDIVDINPDGVKSSLRLVIDHAQNMVDNSGMSEGSQAILWYDVVLPQTIIPPEESYDLSYRWSFEGDAYSVSVEVPVETYEWYVSNPVNRSPQMRGSFAMASFVTSKDAVIGSLVDLLNEIADSKGFDDVDISNFVLSFVQQNIRYSSDNVSKGVEEYWRYPVETLVEKQGDCEDSTILYATIMKKMGYDAVLLFYVLDDDIGHLATGVGIGAEIVEGFFVVHENQRFYYCETTSQGFIVGEKPSDIPEEPELIIDV